MTERRFTYKVGVFVTLGIFLLAVFILVLGGKRGIFKSTFKAYVILEEAQGLAVGSAISAGGLQAGHVESIEFNPNGPGVQVTMRLDNDLRSRITKDSTIALRTQGALGDKYLYINLGSFGGPPIENGAVLEAEPSKDLLTAISKSGDKFEHAFQVVDRLNKILGNINNSGMIEHLAATSRNLDLISASLRGKDAENNKVKKSMDHLESILGKIDKGTGTLGALINDPTISEEIKSILGGAKRSKVLKFLIRQTIQKSEEKEGKDE